MVTHWSADWPVLGVYVVLAAWHLVGLGRLRGASGTAAWPARAGRRREAAAFHAGLLLILAVTVSPVGYLSDRYIWVRMLQALLVGVVAPGLIVLGAPWEALLAAVRRAPAGPPRAAWVTARPALAVTIANVVWMAWLVPALFDRAETSSWVAGAAFVSYLLAGVVFWLQIISSGPVAQATPPLRRMKLVIGTTVASTVVGMIGVFGSNPWYLAYANPAHVIMTVLDDQQLAGAVWWMGMLPPMMTAAVALMMEWFRDEESAELSAGLDRLLTPRRHGWPSRPVGR